MLYFAATPQLGMAAEQPAFAPPDSGKPLRFAGSLVTITVPQSAAQPVALDLHIKMDKGVCKVSRRTPDKPAQQLFTMGEGTSSQRLNPGDTIMLDPQGNDGEYSTRLVPISVRTEVMGSCASALGMMLVAVVAVVFWRRKSHAAFRWFWIGAGLWTVAVAVKVGVALLSNKAVIGLLKAHLSDSLLLACGGLFAGIESSLCEIGLTLLAVLIWRQLGKEAGRAIAVGVGAGAFEAFLVGVGVLVPVIIVLAGLPAAEKLSDQLGMAAAIAPLSWLAGPVERVIAILVHASSRALVLLGVAHHRVGMILAGFAIFTAVDAVAGAAHISGKLGTFSVWWIELAILPLALVSIPILQWCYRRWGSEETNSSNSSIAPAGG
jgi:hypothetical protein